MSDQNAASGLHYHVGWIVGDDTGYDDSHIRDYYAATSLAYDIVALSASTFNAFEAEAPRDYLSVTAKHFFPNPAEREKQAPGTMLYEVTFTYPDGDVDRSGVVMCGRRLSVGEQEIAFEDLPQHLQDVVSAITSGQSLGGLPNVVFIELGDEDAPDWQTARNLLDVVNSNRQLLDAGDAGNDRVTPAEVTGSLLEDLMAAPAVTVRNTDTEAA